MRRIFLIDCPGVVYPAGDSPTDIVLKGVVGLNTKILPELVWNVYFCLSVQFIDSITIYFFSVVDSPV